MLTRSIPTYLFSLLCVLVIEPSDSCFFLPYPSFAHNTARNSSARSSIKMSAEKLDPKETALVLIEYQNEFTTPGGALHDAVKPCMDKYNTLENSEKVTECARLAGCTIVHVPINFEEGHKEISGMPYGILAAIKEGETFMAGKWGADFYESMKPATGDLIAKGKSGLCSFSSTNLDFLLRQNGIQNVVLGGFLTNCCVESTMRTAYENGYKVYTMKDCCAATSIEGHESTYEHNFGMFSVPTTSAEIMRSIALSKPAERQSYIDTL